MQLFKRTSEYPDRRTAKEIDKRIKITKTHLEFFNMKCPACHLHRNDPVLFGIQILQWCKANNPETIRQRLAVEREKIHVLERQNDVGRCLICGYGKYDIGKLIVVGMLEWVLKLRD